MSPSVAYKLWSVGVNLRCVCVCVQVSGEPLYDWIVINVLYTHDMARNEVLRHALTRIEGTMTDYEKQQRKKIQTQKVEGLLVQDLQVKTDDFTNVDHDTEADEHTAKDYDEYSQVSILRVWCCTWVQGHQQLDFYGSVLFKILHCG